VLVELLSVPVLEEVSLALEEVPSLEPQPALLDSPP
jgi:hypothetical protein